jgi:hypothetical protein
MDSISYLFQIDFGCNANSAFEVMGKMALVIETDGNRYFTYIHLAFFQ